jgi:hypothetical protein
MNTFTQTISSNQYIGDSLQTINSNYTNLNNALCNVQTFLDNINNAFSTRTVGITSLDHSVYYSARFTESYSSVASDSYIQFNNLYPGTAAGGSILRKLNNVEYNCDSNGSYTTSANAFYTLNTDGTVTIPAGIYRIDSECSAFWVDSHVTNLINADTREVLIYGSAEYSHLEGRPTTTTYSKMHGRLIFSQPTRIQLKQYIQSFSRGTGLGWTFGHWGGWPTTGKDVADPTTPKLYWSFINIQKTQDYTP